MERMPVHKDNNAPIAKTMAARRRILLVFMPAALYCLFSGW
jgi:hypothetical protein